MPGSGTGYETGTPETAVGPITAGLPSRLPGTCGASYRDFLTSQNCRQRFLKFLALAKSPLDGTFGGRAANVAHPAGYHSRPVDGLRRYFYGE
jgi:hypothetical protein